MTGLTDLICAGFGGQGVLTTGLILAKTAMWGGRNVTWMPAYGSEMRGGTASCNVRVADGHIASPFIKRADVVIAMNEPSALKFQEAVKEGGLLLCNGDLIRPEAITRRDIRVFSLAAGRIAQEQGEPRGANLAMLGALSKVHGVFTRENLERGMVAHFEEKGRNSPANMACYEAGYRQVQEGM